MSELKYRNRRSAIEWEHMNAAGVWPELGEAALDIAKEKEDDVSAAGRAQMLVLAGKLLAAAWETLAMWSQFVTDTVPYGLEVWSPG
jgi:hypothetical protein